MATDHKFKVKNGLHTQNIEFVDSNNTHSITASMLTSDTLSFSGNAGQLFSLTDSMSGTIFSVNDVSGIPSIEVDDDGTIYLAENSGNILIGTGTDDGSTKLQVDGSIKVTGFTTSGQLDVGTQNIKIGNNYIYASGDSNSIHVNAVTSFIPDSTTTANNPDLGLSGYRWKGIYGGFVSSSGDVQADTHFTSSDSNATLSSSGSGGNVYLRPNGKSSTSGQVHISSAGQTTFLGTLKLRNNVSGDDSTIIDIDFLTDATEGTSDDRAAVIRARTSGGTSTTRGGKLIFYTRATNSSNFNIPLTLEANNNSTFAGQIHLTGSSSIRSNNAIAFNEISGAAQTGLFKAVAAQTSYANSASSGMFNALNGYAVGTGTGTTVIDASRNASFSLLEGTGIGVDNTSNSTKRGISLYNGSGESTNPTYGMMFTGTSGSGTHGSVTGDWATYFTMNSTTGRGWIFRQQSGSTNVASISNTGNATFNGTISSGAITSSGGSSGRYTGLEIVNTTNAGGTETAIGLGVVSAGNAACDVKLVANRVAANSGSDFYIEQTDSSGNQQERFRISEAGTITASGNTQFNASSHLFGSSSQTTTDVTIRAQNTAGSPARATTLNFEGYESRGQGLFFTDSGQANKEWFAGIPYNASFARFSIGYHNNSSSQPEYTTNELFSVDTSNNVRVNNVIFLTSTTSYHQIRGRDGNTAIYLGGSGDNRNYYDSAHHRWRTDNGAVDLGEWSQTGLHIGGITTPSEKLEVTGNASIGDAGNISMSAASAGQLKIKGNGYTGAIALDDSAMHIYHNSNSRSLVLGTNETARLTISGSGGATFSSSLTVNSNFLLYSTGSNDAYLNADARDQGNGARMHRFNRDNANSAYLPYYENWYDGNSYHSIGVESNKWRINTGLQVAGSINFSGISQNAYVGLLPETDQNLMLGTGSGNEPRIYLKGTGNGQSDAGDIFIAAGSGGTLIFQTPPTSVGTITIQNSSPVLILDDNNATNSTNQTGYISYKLNGTENGYVGYGSSSTDLFYVAGVASVAIRAGGVNQIIASSTGVTIAGDLTVNGTTTTLNTATLDVEDKNITLNYGTGNTNTSADGAGITIQDAVSSGTDASIEWDSPTDTFNFSHGVNVTGALTSDSLAVDGTAVFDTDTGSSPLQLNRLGTTTGHTQSLEMWVDDANAVFRSEQDETGRYGGFQFVGRHNGADKARYLIESTGGDHYWYANNGNADMHYDATNRRLGIGVINPTDALDVAGTINTNSHGDSSQWNTAYGWGDHASAGYITGVTAGAGLTGGGSSGAVTVAMDWAASDTFTGTYSLVWNASNVPYTASWLQVRGSDDTLLTRNITATGNISSDGLEIKDGEGLRLKGGYRSDTIEGTYYNWFQTGGGTDTSTWWKVCDVTIGTGLYKALALHIRLKSQHGNFGSTEQVVFSDYTAFFPRSGGTQDDNGTPRLTGYDTANHELRIYKTGTGVYQLQSRMKQNYRDLIAEIQVLSTNGGSVTVPSSGTAGTTSGGTAYTAAAPTINSSPEYYMGKTKVSELKQGDNTIVDTIGRIYSGNNGTISSPSISRGTDTNTGFYFPAGDQIGIVTGGVEQARIVSNSFKIGNAGADTDARLAVHGTTTSPNLSSTTPSGYTAVLGNSDVAYGTLFATDGTGRGYIQQRRTNNATTYPLVLQPHGSGVAFNTGTATPNHFYDFVLPSSADSLVVRQDGQTFTPVGTALSGIGIRNTGTSSSYTIFEAQTGSGTAFQIRNNGDARILNNTYVGNGLYVNGTLVIDSARNIKLPNGSSTAPSLRFYVDENTGIFRQYEGVVSFSSDSTNVLDVGKYLRQPYGYTFQFPASTQGWRKLAKIDSRGGGRLLISFTGGNFAPNTYVIDYFKNWSTTCNLKLEQYGTESYITGVRLRTDSSDSKTYLEIYLNNTSSNTENSVYVYDQRLLGYNGTTTVYTGALSAGSSSGTTHSEMDFLPQGSTFNKVNVEEATTLDSTLTVGGQSTLARPVLVNGANDNSGRAELSVNTGGSPQISWNGNQIQAGGVDMNWAGKVVHDGVFRMGAWNSDIHFFSQSSNTGSASGRDIYFSPQISGTGVPTERMRIEGATGDVGIGTSPSARLHVKTGGTGIIARIEGATGRYIYTGTDSSGHYLEQVGTSAAERKFRIQSSNGSGVYSVLYFDGANDKIYTSVATTVGIGTTTPNSGSKLDVAGSVRITSSASDQTNSADSTTIPATSGADVLRLQGGYTNGTYTTEIAKIDRVGNLPLYIRESRGTANSFTNLMRIGGHGRADGGYTAEVFGHLKVAGDILSTGNEHYFISTNNYIEVDQNTGTKFRFNLNGAKQAELIRVSGAHGQFAVDQYSTNATAATYPAFTEMGDTDTGLFFPADNEVGLTTGGTERLRVDSSGNVGIGTTDPQSFPRLDVRSTYATSAHAIAAYGYSTNGTAILANGYAGTGSGNNYGIRAVSTGNRGSSPGSVNIGGHFSASGAVSNYALTTGSGNVGIGSLTPGRLLDVGGAGQGNVTGIRGSVNNQVNITHSGNTGWGLLLGNSNSSSNSGYHYSTSGNNNSCAIINVQNDALHFGTNNDLKMTIRHDGHVGIGTNNPQKILDVITPNNDFVSFARTLSTNNWTGIHFGYRENNNSYRKSAIVFERTDLTAGNAQGKVHILNGPQSGSGNCSLSDAALTIRENGAVVLPKSVLEFENGSNTITASMLSSDTLSFSGDSGQLFSLTDSMSGTIFSVNDVSGIPSIEVEDDGTIYLAESTGNVLIGTGTDDGSTKLQVDGSIKVEDGSLASPSYSFVSDTDSGMTSIASNAIGFITGGAQRFKINSNGLLLTGTSSLYVNGQETITSARSIANVVNYENTDGHMQLHRTGNAALIINRKGTTTSSKGELLNFKSQNAKVGRIGYTEPFGGLMYLTTGNTSGNGVGVYSSGNTQGSFYPVTLSGGNLDDTLDLGTTAARWDDVYATNGTIQTSDRNEKQDIQALTDAETRVATACKGLIRRYRWISSVEEKGDDARYHFGAIAQDVESAFSAEGLDAGDYGLFIRSTWWEHGGHSYPSAAVAPTGAVEKTRLGIRYNQLFAFIISAL